MEDITEYEGFTISTGIIREGKLKYMGYIAKKRGIRIESPMHEPYNYNEIKQAINEFIRKSVSL